MNREITIVGPSTDQTERKKGHFSNNIESVLLMAKYNRSFRKKILKKPETAFKSCDIPLKESDKLLLSATPKSQLKQIIDNFHIKGITKRSLVNWKMASLVLALVSSVSMGQIADTELISLQGNMPWIRRTFTADELKIFPFDHIGVDRTGAIIIVLKDNDNIKPNKKVTMFVNGKIRKPEILNDGRENFDEDGFGSFKLKAKTGDGLTIKAKGYLPIKFIVGCSGGTYQFDLEKK